MEIHSLMDPNDILHTKCYFSKFDVNKFGIDVRTAEL